MYADKDILVYLLYLWINLLSVPKLGDLGLQSSKEKKGNDRVSHMVRASSFLNFQAYSSHLALELEDTIEQCLSSGGTTGNVHINRDNTITTTDDRV